MTSPAVGTGHQSAPGAMLQKVPEATALFWIIKVLTTVCPTR